MVAGNLDEPEVLIFRRNHFHCPEWSMSKGRSIVAMWLKTSPLVISCRQNRPAGVGPLVLVLVREVAGLVRHPATLAEAVHRDTAVKGLSSLPHKAFRDIKPP